MQKTPKDYWFVGLQMILLVLFVVTPSKPQIPLFKIVPILGLIFAAIGIVIVLFSILQLSNALTPFPSPKQGASLKTDGLYQFSRHPIYAGILLFCIGWTFYSASFSRLFLTAALYALFFFKSNYEEQQLIAFYGEDYVEYKKKTARFFLY